MLCHALAQSSANEARLDPRA